MSHYVLAINSGSSSLKFQLFSMPEETVITSGLIERIGIDAGVFTIKLNGEKKVYKRDFKDHTEAVAALLEAFKELKIVSDLSEIHKIGHRIVQGGSNFDQSVVATDDVVKVVEELADLAPLHNPANLVGYRAFKKELPEAKHVFVFDTAFHQTLTEDVYLYPIPYEYYEQYKVRRYGAHGTSHQYISQRTAELMEKKPEDLNMITLHLGNGASITAIEKGKSVNTSMGFTPLDGIMMGTRSGSLDPAITTYLMEKTGKSAKEIVDIYNKKSGMLGISGFSSDARDIEQGIEEGNARAILTRKIYVRRIMEVVGGYVMQLGHVDALVFSGGLGENDAQSRQAIIDSLSAALGVKLDPQVNAATHGSETKISAADSTIDVWVTPTNEELVIARDTDRLV